jgi:3-isopropylmalate/(R)-2-methylmalate dehydratase small subunit
MQDVKRTILSGKAISVDGNDIDTDRIIPARFLRCVTFDDLGAHAFEDDRKQLKEAGKQHPFDDASRQEARILLADRNFGCGSSREHAPQALMRWNKGIMAIVGESFSEIFFGNCVALGIPCVTTDEASMGRLMAESQRDPKLRFKVDLDSMTAKAGQVAIKVSMPEGARGQLMAGRWDSTAELLEGKGEIKRTADTLPYFSHWS